jgi:hypothetical protein
VFYKFLENFRPQTKYRKRIQRQTVDKTLIHYDNDHRDITDIDGSLTLTLTFLSINFFFQDENGYDECLVVIARL